MSWKINFRIVDFILKLMDNKPNESYSITFEPQKTLFDGESAYEQAFPRSTPEKQGISSEYICDFFEALKNEPKAAVHSIMILRNGYVIAEGSFSPYRSEVWHSTYSLCKSITALAIGFAVDEGLLDVEDSLTDILQNEKMGISLLLKKNVHLKHLLTMSSGISLNEVLVPTSNKWLEDFLKSSVLFEPGKKFRYNSMNTYLLGVILKEVTGQSITEYLKPRLFEPLGIKKIMWEKSAEGYEKAGFGMYIGIEDVAKIAQFCLQEGRWKGKQLISKEWIKEMSAKHIETKDTEGCGYGYQVWMSHRKGAYQFNGMLGQTAIIMPDIQMVVVTTGGSTETGRDTATNLLIEKYFGGDFEPKEALLTNPLECMRLRKICKSLERDKDMPEAGSRKAMERWEEISEAVSGTSYEPENIFIGLLPMVVQYINNNRSKGISLISFNRYETGFYISVKEGETTNTIPVDFSGYSDFTVIENDEPFLCSAKSAFIINEDNIPVLKIKLHFLETSGSRIMKFYFRKKGIVLYMDETPAIDELSAENGVKGMLGISDKLINQAKERINEEKIRIRIDSVIRPKINLKKI